MADSTRMQYALQAKTAREAKERSLDSTKLLVQCLDLGAIPLPICILQCIALKHEVCSHRLNVQPVGYTSEQSNPCTTSGNHD